MNFFLFINPNSHCLCSMPRENRKRHTPKKQLMKSGMNGQSLFSKLLNRAIIEHLIFMYNVQIFSIICNVKICWGFLKLKKKQTYKLLNRRVILFQRPNKVKNRRFLLLRFKQIRRKRIFRRRSLNNWVVYGLQHLQFLKGSGYHRRRLCNDSG